MLKRLSSSIAFWLIMMLCSANLMIACAITAYDPLKWLEDMELISLDNLGITKIPDILQSNSNSPVVILGSSLMLFPAYRIDEQLGLGNAIRLPNKHEHLYRLLSYSKAEYFEDLLENRRQKPVSVTNAAVAGSLVSDQYLIAKKYLTSGKRPKLVLITIAPRDFLDNERKEVERTPTQFTLSQFMLPNEFASMLISDPEAAFRKSGNLVHTGLNGFSACYKYRSDIQQLTSGIAAKVTGFPASLIHVRAHMEKDAIAALPPPALAPVPELPTQQQKQDGAPQNTLSDLPGYQKMYLPVNQELFQKQRTAFGSLLNLLQSENIPTIVVDMPLTKENLAILPEPVLSQYRTFIKSSCQAYGAQLWRPEMDFELADFSDSAHLNARGGKKFFSALESHIASVGQQL